ncbi:MAG TPA: hypothetical protein VE174_13355 [Actinomycetota bacterium]|nr:hypothetical protein [Actinomycetota bacterium]
MTETSFEISPEGQQKIEAVDLYLEEAIRDDRPIEALIATRRIGEIVTERTKEAARVATEGSSSWSDVGEALGMTRQAAHEKLRERVRGEINKGRAKIDRAEKAGHAKISRRATRGRDKLEQAAPFSPKVEIARQRIDEWEQGKHDKLTQDLEKAREELARAEQAFQEKLDS